MTISVFNKQFLPKIVKTILVALSMRKTEKRGIRDLGVQGASAVAALGLQDKLTVRGSKEMASFTRVDNETLYISHSFNTFILLQIYM